MLAMILVAGCARQAELSAVEARVEALEQQRVADQERIAALEARIAAAPSNLAPDPLPLTAEAEEAAARLLKDASAAVDAGRPEDAKALLGRLMAEYPASRAARAASRLKSELDIVGITAPPLAVERWFQGSEADLEGGTAVLYVFFEQWCPHCKRELPKLVETEAQYRDQGLRVVALTKMTRDTTEEQVNAFVSEGGLTFPVGLEQNGSLSEAYGVSGIPAAAVVRDGVVVWRGHPAKLTPAMIEGWL